MPELELHKLEEIQKAHPDKYQAAYAKAKSDWAEKLKTIPYYERTVIGDASETALVKFFQPIVDFRKTYQTGLQFDDSPAIIPFNSSYKYALQIKTMPDDPLYSFEVYIKGAPEHMWARCTSVFSGGKVIPRNAEIDRNFEEANKVSQRTVKEF